MTARATTVRCITTPVNAAMPSTSAPRERENDRAHSTGRNIHLMLKSLDVQGFTAIDGRSLHAAGPVEELRVNAQRAGYAIQVATVPALLINSSLATSATAARDGLELQTNFHTAVPISSGPSS